MKTMVTLALAATAFATAPAAAVITVNPVSAVGSSSFPGYNDIFAIDTGPGSATSDWASLGQGTSSFLDLDLGAVFQLVSASVTDRVTSGGGNGGFVGGVSDFTTSYSLTAYTDATFTTTIGSPVIVNKLAPVGPTGPGDFLSTANLTGITARYVRYNVLGAAGGNVGLSNISFNAVPEPSTWALLIVGFGMVGVAARRRKSVVAA